ncbi:PrsW family intramembrane metalloprotease [Kribbella kalugense]|uniref:RsiW-degrading membrane proteinase PrsW (M82 family) n=1 Tax=Kribbella kalugense TaxID=2512221 RepID=A0A4R7ZU12_9ACTN|nr:PrsW family glutamic-type intramembrane protease [Kribbella kalugense]TDW21342.1 RsiW-degrading membrane proteinase PrsW (M82 family) [Kribbella kalugense]
MSAGTPFVRLPDNPHGAGSAHRRDTQWVRIFLAGFVLWLTSLIVTLLTGNANLVPTLILLGSFLVPVTFVAWAFERWRDTHVTAELIVKAFVIGGLLGVLAASLLETYLLQPSPWLFLGVGLIEEAAKLGALVFVTRHLAQRHGRDGFVLGAAVGFGFAAFESAGYAFNALLTVKGLSLTALVETELLRSMLAPFGHGLWTAVLGGVLFREARAGRFRFNRAVLLMYLWVSVLHALWDSSHSIALALTFVLTGTSWQYRLLSMGYLPTPTSEQVHVFTLLSIGLLAVVALVGLATLRVSWRRTPPEKAHATALHKEETA